MTEEHPRQLETRGEQRARERVMRRRIWRYLVETVATVIGMGVLWFLFGYTLDEDAEARWWAMAWLVLLGSPFVAALVMAFVPDFRTRAAGTFLGDVVCLLVAAAGVMALLSTLPAEM